MQLLPPPLLLSLILNSELAEGPHCAERMEIERRHPLGISDEDEGRGRGAVDRLGGTIIGGHTYMTSSIFLQYMTYPLPAPLSKFQIKKFYWVFESR